MTRWLRFSSWIYRAILLLYPDDLRLDFGAEMTEVFTEDLARAWLRRGPSGVAAVWCCAASEIVSVAIPERLENPAVRARAVSVALHIAVMGGIIAIGTFSQAMPRVEWHGIVALKLPSQSSASTPGR